MFMFADINKDMNISFKDEKRTNPIRWWSEKNRIIELCVVYVSRCEWVWHYHQQKAPIILSNHKSINRKERAKLLILFKIQFSRNWLVLTAEFNASDIRISFLATLAVFTRFSYLFKSLKISTSLKTVISIQTLAVYLLCACTQASKASKNVEEKKATPTSSIRHIYFFPSID